MKKSNSLVLILAVLFIVSNCFVAYSANGSPSGGYQLIHRNSSVIGHGARKQNEQPPDHVDHKQGIWMDLLLLEEKQNEHHTITVDQEHNYVIVVGAVTEDEYSRFITYLNKIDKKIIERYRKDNWKVVLTNADLDHLLLRGVPIGVKGYTSFDHKTIYINSGEFSYCIIHEMGHFIDYCSGFASMKEEFQRIFEAESANLTQYGKTHPIEFFAEVYMYGILKKDELGAACPASVNYLTDYINRLSY